MRAWFAKRPGLTRIAVGILLGVLLDFGVRYTLNKTTLVDTIVAPLVIADTPVSGRADVIVVLGAGITGFCTPNLNGIQRVLLATRLYDQGRAPLVVITGGAERGSPCTAASAMRDLALRLGTPARDIRLEEVSRSTWENAERSDAILRTLGAKRILLVTDRPHMLRSEAVFRRFGYEIERASVPIPLGNINNSGVLWVGLREYFALASYWLRGYISDEPAARAMVAAIEKDPVVEADAGGTPVVKGIVERRNDHLAVILGASYAKGWTPSEAAGVRFDNRGVGGEQAFEMLKRFDADVAAQSPRAVIIWGFINDIMRSPRDTLDQSLARVRESYVEMVGRSKRAGIEPILATEVTIRNRTGWQDELMTFVGGLLGKQDYPAYVNRHVLDTNEWIRELARREGLMLLDLEPVLSQGTGRRARAFSNADGSHITASGYEALTQYALPVLRDHFGPPR